VKIGNKPDLMFLISRGLVAVRRRQEMRSSNLLVDRNGRRIVADNLQRLFSGARPEQLAANRIVVASCGDVDLNGYISRAPFYWPDWSGFNLHTLVQDATGATSIQNKFYAIGLNSLHALMAGRGRKMLELPLLYVDFNAQRIDGFLITDRLISFEEVITHNAMFSFNDAQITAFFRRPSFRTTEVVDVARRYLNNVALSALRVRQTVIGGELFNEGVIERPAWQRIVELGRARRLVVDTPAYFREMGWLLRQSSFTIEGNSEVYFVHNDELRYTFRPDREIKQLAAGGHAGGRCQPTAAERKRAAREDPGKIPGPDQADQLPGAEKDRPGARLFCYRRPAARRFGCPAQ
jgi:hypothetical protein